MPEKAAPRKRRLARCAAIAAVGCVAALVVVLALRGALARGRLSARIEALLAAGEPVTLGDVAALYRGLPRRDGVNAAFNKAFDAVNACSPTADELRLPVVGNARLPEPHEALPADVLEGMRAALARRAEALRLLHEAAGVGDYGFHIDFAGPLQVWGYVGPTTWEPTRLLVLEAIERVERGEADEAAASLATALRIVHAVRRQPFVAPALLRLTCIEVVLRGLARLANRAWPSPAALQELEGALSQAAAPELAEQAILAQRCLVICSERKDFSGYMRQRTLDLGDYLGVRGGVVGRLLRRVPLRAASLAAERLLYVDAATEVIAALRRPYPESLIRAVRVASRRGDRVPTRCIRCGPLVKHMATLVAETQQQMGELDSARLALAALRYRAEHGRLPESLQALVPDYVDAVPPDPFDGEPLRYRATDDGFVVYAVGANGSDDDGDLDWDQAKSHYPDIGFRVRWPKGTD